MNRIDLLQKSCRMCRPDLILTNAHETENRQAERISFESFALVICFVKKVFVIVNTKISYRLLNLGVC